MKSGMCMCLERKGKNWGGRRIGLACSQGELEELSSSVGVVHLKTWVIMNLEGI